MAAVSKSHGIGNDQVPGLMLQDSGLAVANFGLDGQYFNTVPKSKFMFFVRFVRIGIDPTSNSFVPSVAQNMTSGQNMSQYLGFIVKSITQPKMSFETEVCNQYNRKRIIQKKVEYKPIDIKFHDTVDNRIMKMFQDYFEFYYGDSKITNWSEDIVTKELTKGFGFIPSTLSGGLAGYFSKIEVYELFAGYYSQYDLINPRILSFDPDDHDYSAVNVSHEVGMSIGYEGVNFTVNTQPLQPDLIKMMNLDMSDFYEPDSGPISGGQLNPARDKLAALGTVTSNLPPGNLSGIIGSVTQGVDSALNVSGVFSGALNTVNDALNNFNYNAANTGTITPNTVSTSVPSQRNVEILTA